MRDPKELVLRIYDAINARDPQAMEKLGHPHLVVETTVETFHGLAGALEWLAQVDETLEGYRAEVTAIEEIGGQVVASVHQTGRGKGSGVEVDHVFTHVWALRGGKAYKLKAFTDREEALRYAEVATP